MGCSDPMLGQERIHITSATLAWWGPALLFDHENILVSLSRARYVDAMRSLTLYHIRMLAIVILIGSGVGAVMAMTQSGVRPDVVLAGIIDGGIISLLIGVYILVITTSLKPMLRRLPFLLVLILNSLVFLFLIGLGRGLGGFLIGRSKSLQIIQTDSQFMNSITYGFVITLILNFQFQIAQIIGFKQVFAFIRGGFHKPRTEQRTFVFLDIEGSTSIAERIGDEKFLSLLDDFLHALSESIVRSGGEIYKYVGDEIILSWPANRSDQAIGFLVSARQTLAARSALFQKKYGMVPEFRASAHSGSVVAGELGDLKKEIAYSGDLLNTASRMLSETKILKCVTVVSRETVERLQVRPAGLVSLGKHRFRGKERPVEIFKLF